MRISFSFVNQKKILKLIIKNNLAKKFSYEDHNEEGFDKTYTFFVFGIGKLLHLYIQIIISCLFLFLIFKLLKQVNRKLININLSSFSLAIYVRNISQINLQTKNLII